MDQWPSSRITSPSTSSLHPKVTLTKLDVQKARKAVYLLLRFPNTTIGTIYTKYCQGNTTEDTGIGVPLAHLTILHHTLPV